MAGARDERRYPGLRLVPPAPSWIPRSVRDCGTPAGGTLAFVRRDGTGDVLIRPCLCRSFRHAGRCACAVRRELFERLMRGEFGSANPAHCTVFTLTFDPKRQRTIEDCYRAVKKTWPVVHDRLRFAFPDFRYFLTVEEHESGRPHFHGVAVSAALAEHCGEEALRQFRKRPRLPDGRLKSGPFGASRELKEILTCAGYGDSSIGFGWSCSWERVYNTDSAARYLLKPGDDSATRSAGSEVVKADDRQCATHAIKGFRSYRASRGFLAPRKKGTTYTGRRFAASPERVQEVVARAPTCRRRNVEPSSTGSERLDAIERVLRAEWRRNLRTRKGGPISASLRASLLQRSREGAAVRHARWLARIRRRTAIAESEAACDVAQEVR